MPASPPTPRLLLPPPFQAIPAGPGDILDLAESCVQNGAGTLLWRDSGDVLALAVVMEPGPPLVTDQAGVELGYLAALAAVCDMLTQHGLPERRIALHWPDRIIYDQALLAGARWRMGPAGTDGLPEWVIFAAEIIADRPGLADPGLYPASTSLTEEEFPEPPALIESFAAYLKLVVDRWSQDGPDAVLRRILERVHQPDALAGAQIRDGRLHLPPLTLNESSWRDPAREGPAW